MSDLTDRLRTAMHSYCREGEPDGKCRLLLEAADRIEELDAEVMRWKTGQARWQNSALAARIEELEAKVADLTDDAGTFDKWWKEANG